MDTFHTHTNSHTHTHIQLILAGTEQFNKKPSQGITFLQEQCVLRTPTDPVEVAQFLLDNPRLDKAMIGEYIGDRRRQDILEEFVKYEKCLSALTLWCFCRS